MGRIIAVVAVLDSHAETKRQNAARANRILVRLPWTLLRDRIATAAR
jgi:hypothetical protein